MVNGSCGVAFPRRVLQLKVVEMDIITLEESGA